MDDSQRGLEEKEQRNLHVVFDWWVLRVASQVEIGLALRGHFEKLGLISWC